MGWRSTWSHRHVLGVLAVTAAAAAVVLKWQVFPLLSINSDEAINAFFADTLTRGRLFAPTMGDADAFRPWLAATSDDHYVLKYTPVVAAVVAASVVVAGGPGLYLATLGAATVLATHLLAREVLGDATEALVATALVSLSPLVVVHSALLLSYLPSFVLLELFAWGLLRGISRGRPWLLAISGLSLGLAAFVRSFDAVVFSVPLLAWAVLARRREAVAPAAWFAGAAAVPMAAFAAFNAAASGHPLRLPFSLLEPADTLGFGRRRLYPTDRLRDFGVTEGLSGLLRHGLLLNWWVAGGTVLIVLAGATLARRRVDGRLWALVLAGALIPAAYVGFWGPWNASVLWGGDRYVGPFYFLPVLLPLALCGARGLVDLHRWRPQAGVALGVVMAVVSAATMAVAVDGNRRFTDHNRALRRLVVPEAEAAPRLVFVDAAAPFLMHPSAVLSNRSDLTGPVLFAVARGEADLDLVRRFPDRTPYLLRFEADFTDHRRPLGARLERVHVVTAPRLPLRLTIHNPDEAATTMEITAAGVATSYAVAPGASSHDLVVTSAGPHLANEIPRSTRPVPTEDLEIRLIRTGSDTVAASERYPLRREGPTLHLIAPTGDRRITDRTSSPTIDLTS